MVDRIISNIYMDNQASTPMDPRVLAAMAPYFTEKPGNPHAADHSFGWEANQAIELAAKQVASSINADPDEIIFTSGATEANNLFLLGAAAHAKNGNRKRIITSAIEHKSVLEPLAHAASIYGYHIDIINVFNDGIIDFNELENKISEDVLLVSIVSVNNEIGTLQELFKISSLCKKYGSLFHSDSVHLLSTEKIDVEKNGIDALSLSAHKFYGPKGVGALYIKREIQRVIEPLFFGGGQQQELRPGTMPVTLCVGLGKAITLFDGKSGEEERKRIRQQKDTFISSLLESGLQFRVNGRSGLYDHPGNANICFIGVNAHELLGSLQPTLAAATGSACTSGSIQGSHVLYALGLPQEDVQASIRFSLGRFTTDKEIDEAVALISRAVRALTDR